MTTFDLSNFLNEVYRVTSGTIVVFCGKEQISDIYRYFQEKQDKHAGDIIFDPCCGSGAHCLVAKENGRNYIGCEINKDYFEIAQNRLLDVS